MAEMGLLTAYNYSNQHLSYSSIIQVINYLIKSFYLFIMLLVAFLIFIIASLFFKRQLKFRINYAIIQYLLTTPIAVCLTAAFANSYIIPGVIWTSSVLDYIYSSELYLRSNFDSI
jgi:hypothetical protein